MQESIKDLGSNSSTGNVFRPTVISSSMNVGTICNLLAFGGGRGEYQHIICGNCIGMFQEKFVMVGIKESPHRIDSVQH